LITDDPTSPTTTLLVRAQIATAVRVLPDVPILLRNDAWNRPVRRVIRRSLGSGHGFFSVGGLRSSAPWIDARARKVRENAPASGDLPAVEVGDWILELRLNGQPPYGQRRETVEFQTGLERQPDVRLAVQTDLAAPVQFPVERLFLQPRGDAAEESIPIVLRSGLDPSGLEVEALPDGLIVRLEPADEERTWTAHVRWPGERLDRGRLVFRIAGERVELPVLYQPSH
jgi:hypothetical protein